jgi:hypothetical protein
MLPYHVKPVQRGMRTAAVEKHGVMLLAVVMAAAVSAHLSVSTSKPQAQAAFDRGLFLYYAYNGEEAARDFEQAAALDARLAMAYWGVALADGPDLNTPITKERYDLAARAIQKAVLLETNATADERRFIDVMSLRFQGPFSNWPADDASYRHAMLAFAQTSQDENVQLLAAEALLEHGGLAWQNGRLASDDSQVALVLVENVLREDPPSVMANHLCIHLYDLAPERNSALECAQRLDAAMFPPPAEHLAHMPAHYWIETGNYAAALRSSERAYSLLDQLAAAEPHSEHFERYAKHDVAVGYSAAMMLGSYAQAAQWAARMSSLFDISFEAITALRFGRFETAYAADPNGFGGVSIRGLAALRLGHVAQARALAPPAASSNSMSGYLPQLFRAALAQADGKYDEAERQIQRGIQIEHAVFVGELIPLLPLEEALGDFRLQRGDAAGAVSAFNAALSAYPNDPRALFGLAQALAADGQSAQGIATRAQFEREWEGADTNAVDALL